MSRSHRIETLLITAIASLIAISVAVGQDDKKSATNKTDAGKDVVDDLQKKLKKRPTIAPTKPAVPKQVRPTTPEVDPRVIGVAPGGKQPKLRREGEFVINRRGRLVRAADGAHFLYTFDADSKGAPEAPMIMMPCQLLESMEKLISERGDKVVFNTSGQVFVYKGANYLLPSIMREDYDRGNLK